MNISMKTLFLCGSVLSAAVSAQAAELSIAANSTGKNIAFFKERIAAFEKETGHKVNLVTMPSSSSEQFSQYRLWLAAGNKDVDVYQTDVVWAPQLADQFVDLTEAAKDVVGQHFPSIIASQTVNGRLVAGVQQHDGGGDEFVIGQKLAAMFGMHHVRKQVVARLGAAL